MVWPHPGYPTVNPRPGVWRTFHGQDCEEPHTLALGICHEIRGSNYQQTMRTLVSMYKGSFLWLAPRTADLRPWSL